MVITAAQTAAFFQNPNQMGIPAASMPSLNAEGITVIDDLAEFSKEDIEAMASNFRRATPPIVFGARSQKRLIIACEAVRYYETIGHALTPGMMQWDPTLKNFAEQMKALKELKDGDDDDVPVISKALPVMKWAEAFRDHLHQSVGVRDIPLVYITREEEVPPHPAPALAPGLPHSADAGSIAQEMINRASHNHPNFRYDSGKVYHKMEVATRGTPYAASIKPFQRRKDGRGAHGAVVTQHAGRDKWALEITKNDNFLHTRKWKGNGTFPLERFCAQHRNAHEQLKLAGAYVQFQLPTEHTRVTYLLEAIETSDAALQAAMANIEQDDGPNGKRNDFEAAVAFLLPRDPVAKKRKRNAASISAATATTHDDANVSAATAATLKSGIGKTGVHLRFHTSDEYARLNKRQKNELRLWRQTPEGKAASTASKNATGGKQKQVGKGKKNEANVSSIVKEEVECVLIEKAQKLKNEEKEKEEAKAEFRTAVAGALAEMSEDTASGTYDKKALAAIIGRAKNK